MRFHKAGLVAIGCNIHDAMQAFIQVVDTPFARKSDAAGHGAPPARLPSMPARPRKPGRDRSRREPERDGAGDRQIAPSRSELNSSAEVMNRIWAMHGQELESVARPLALDFGFREAVATNDDATIRSALYNITTRIDVPNAFVVKYDGRVIGTSAEEDARYDAELWDELDSGWQAGALRLDDQTF